MPTGASSARDESQHRLTDMLVEEVSFVDRGANKKRFLLVKRDKAGGPMAGELVPDGRGGMKRVKKGAAEETDEEKARKAAAAGKKPPFGGNKAPPFKPGGSGGGGADDEEEEDDDDEEEKKRKAAAAGDEEEEEETDEEKARKAAAAGDDDEFAPEEKKKPKGMTKADVRKSLLASVTQAIELLMDVAEDLKDGGDDEEEEGEYSPPDAVTANAKKAMGLLAKVLGVDAVKSYFGKALGLATTITAKAGRRMSKERLDRFTKALADLQSILKEVMAAPELKDDAEKRGAALMKAFAKVAKSAMAGGGGNDGRVDQLLDAITELTELSKAQEAKIGKLEKRAEVLRKGGGLSNALGVETREDTGERGRDGVEWPMDLNRPIDKAHTDGETSFYDEEEET